MNKKLLVLFAMMLAAVSSAATDEDPISTSTSLDKEVLDSSASEDEEVDSIEDLLDVGDLEYEDEDSSSGDGVGRYLRAHDRRPGMGGGRMGGRHGRGHHGHGRHGHHGRNGHWRWPHHGGHRRCRCRRSCMRSCRRFRSLRRCQRICCRGRC